MQLRQLGTEWERQIFARRVVQARARRNVGSAETPRSRLGAVHVAFGNVYALFEHDDDPPERMISGMVVHDLETLPQSYSKPDLTHLPPRSVVEIGELWSLSRGGGLLAKGGLLVLLTMSGTKAVLVYAIAKPSSTVKSFAAGHFEKVGEPINYPYARALDGSPVWVQPMVLWEEGMRRVRERMSATRFEVSDDLTRVRFDNPLPFQPSVDRPAFSLDESPVPPYVAASNGSVVGAPDSAQR